jgi:hypothetical protein
MASKIHRLQDLRQETFLSQNDADGDDIERCPSCQQYAETDIVIRCPLCFTAHHLSCYSKTGGCAVFGCLQPQRSNSNQNVELLTEHIFRSEIHLQFDNSFWRNETTLAISALGMTALFFMITFLFT